MYRSLMFKTDPLTEEIEKFKKKFKQALESKQISGRRNKTPIDASKHNIIHALNITPPKVTKTPPKSPINHIPTKQNGRSTSPDEKSFTNEERQKHKFKIHNIFTVKNDNFVNRQYSPQPGVLKKTIQQKDKTQVGRNLKQQNRNKFDDRRKYSISPQAVKKTEEAHRDSTSRDGEGRKIPVDRPKNQQKILNLQQKNASLMENGFKSTLYQSIDLQNLFDKIQAKMDLSKTSKNDTSSRSNNNKVQSELQQSNSLQTSFKQKKIIQKLRSQLSSQGLNKQPTNILKQFNLKALVQSRLAEAKLQKTQPYTPQPSSYTSPDNYFPKPNDIDNMINSLSYNDIDQQKSWLPATKKKSSMIVIDEKGKMMHQNQSVSMMKKRMIQYQSNQFREKLG